MNISSSQTNHHFPPNVIPNNTNTLICCRIKRPRQNELLINNSTVDIQNLSMSHNGNNNSVSNHRSIKSPRP